eukprot:scaffold157205_cov38-Prasinocladus_malaysianus.AAC.1
MSHLGRCGAESTLATLVANHVRPDIPKPSYFLPYVFRRVTRTSTPYDDITVKCAVAIPVACVLPVVVVKKLALVKILRQGL